MGLRASFVLTLAAAVAGMLPCCLCDPSPQMNRAASHGPDMTPRAVAKEARPSSLLPPPREPGPHRQEPRRQVAAAREEAGRLVSSLAAGGIDAREAASVADMRGYRLYRKRHIKKAQAWFEAAVKADPSFEPPLLNAARCAVLLNQPERARGHLRTLKQLDTPLARSRLNIATSDPDFAPLRSRRHRP